jgi:hypothetical protein
LLSKILERSGKKNLKMLKFAVPIEPSKLFLDFSEEEKFESQPEPVPKLSMIQRERRLTLTPIRMKGKYLRKKK